MKKLSITLGLALFLSTFTFAQRFAYVDVNEILNSLPDYQSAQQELDKQAATWRQDIAQKYDEIKGMYNRYQAEQVLLNDDQRAEREETIMAKEKEVREFQKNKFGPDGALFQRRQELVQPIQDKVYGAIESYAESNSYDFIFDKGGNAGMIFTNAKFDLTEEIMKVLGINK